ncbi:periplasmic binding protein-like II [Atractiella rhizophila]|nr:periplasmic binding protein-like II [Atractiella rhizophila]
MIVPEHFSSPILRLGANDPSISLVNCPSGTGQMISRLRAGEIDVSVALTESLLAGIANGPKFGKGEDYKIVGTYVVSPLNWAIICSKHSPQASSINSLSDLRGKKWGISRIGSGSQIMVSYLALKEGWVDGSGKVEPIDFVVNDSFENLRRSVQEGTTAAFMWEYQTTKPWFDTNEVYPLTTCPTPWPSWSIACNASAPKEAVTKFLEDLQKSVEEFQTADRLSYIVKEFGYKEPDVKRWLETVKWKEGSLKEVDKEVVRECLDILTKASAIKKPEGMTDWTVEDFVDTKIARLETAFSEPN